MDDIDQAFTAMLILVQAFKEHKIEKYDAMRASLSLGMCLLDEMGCSETQVKDALQALIDQFLIHRGRRG